jgi:hypothetical protein
MLYHTLNCPNISTHPLLISHLALHVLLELCLERLALSPQLYSPFLRLHGKPNVANLLRKHTLDP